MGRRATCRCSVGIPWRAGDRLRAAPPRFVTAALALQLFRGLYPLVPQKVLLSSSRVARQPQMRIDKQGHPGTRKDVYLLVMVAAERDEIFITFHPQTCVGDVMDLHRFVARVRSIACSGDLSARCCVSLFAWNERSRPPSAKCSSER